MLEGLGMCWKVSGCVGRFRDVLEVLGVCWKVWGCVEDFGMC